MASMARLAQHVADCSVRMPQLCVCDAQLTWAVLLLHACVLGIALGSCSPGHAFAIKGCLRGSSTTAHSLRVPSDPQPPPNPSPSSPNQCTRCQHLPSPTRPRPNVPATVGSQAGNAAGHLLQQCGIGCSRRLRGHRRLTQKSASSGSNSGTPISFQPSVQNVQYSYQDLAQPGQPGSSTSASGDQLAETWVVAAWTFSNLTAWDAMNGTAAALITSITQQFQLQASQVVTLSSANVTLGYVFAGIPPRDDFKWIPNHLGFYDATVTKIITNISAQTAGGFEHIQVLFEAPYYGSKLKSFEDSGNQTVVWKDVAGLEQQQQQQQQQQGSLGSRRLLQQYQPTASAAVLLPRCRRTSYNTRRLLQQSTNSTQAAIAPTPPPAAAAGADKTSEATSSWSPQPGLTPIWVTYTNLHPSDIHLLISTVAKNCGGLLLVKGEDLTDTVCGRGLREKLTKAGLKVNTTRYKMTLQQSPMVSFNLQVTITLTSKNGSKALAMDVATWLGQPGVIVTALDSSRKLTAQDEAYARIKWLRTPEVWIKAQPAQGPVFTWTAGATAGVALGIAAFIGIVTGAVLFLLLRLHKRRHKLQDQHNSGSKDAATDNGSTGSSRSRRRRQGKRRYLMPDPPTAVTQAAAAAPTEAAAVLVASTGGGSTVPTPASVATASAVFTSDAQQLEGSTTSRGLSRDISVNSQLRPGMKELGDSVTSAVRYEQDDIDGHASTTGSGTLTEQTGDPTHMMTWGIDRPMASTVMQGDLALGNTCASNEDGYSFNRGSRLASGRIETRQNFVLSNSVTTGQAEPGTAAAAVAGFTRTGSVQHRCHAQSRQPSTAELAIEGREQQQQQQQKEAHQCSKQTQVVPGPALGAIDAHAGASRGMLADRGLAFSATTATDMAISPGQPVDVAAMGAAGHSTVTSSHVKASPFASAYDFGKL